MTTETANIEAEINRSRHALNDTIEALGGKLTPGQIVDEAMGLLKGQAGKLTADLGRQVRDNPLPLLLIGAGVAMYFLHKQGAPPALSDEHAQAHSQFSALEAARTATIRAHDEDEPTWAHRLHEVEAEALGLKQEAGEAIDAFKQRVKAAGDSLAKAAAGARDRIAAGYSSATHAITGGAAAAGQFVSDQAHHAKQTAGDLKHGAQTLYADNPLAAGAIGVAIGALIGSFAPLSPVERDHLSGVADLAKDKAANLTEQGARAVQGLADKAVAALH